MNITGGSLDFEATLNDSRFNRGINNMEHGINRITGGMQQQGNEIESFAKKAAAAATAYFSVQAIEGFVSSLIDVRSQFQQLDIAFSTMLKSKVAADTLMKELITFAGTTPFGLKDAAGAAKQLLAYGSTAKTVVGELRMLGDVASGVSIPIVDLVYLYGTLKTQGRAYAMDIRQFAGRGIPIYAELAKVLGVAKDEVTELVSAGKVGFKEVEQAFQNMTATGGMFGGLMEAQSKSWTGQIERFKDAWDVMLNDMGKSSDGIFATGISAATTMVENYEKVLQIIGTLVVGFGAYRTALLVTAAATTIATYATAGFTAAEILSYYWTQTLTKAQKILNATMLANPYAAVAAALAALATYLYLAEDATLKVKTASELTAEAVKMQGDNVSTAESKLRVYVEMLKNTNLSEVERLSIYNKIKDIDPSIVKGLDAKTISYGNLKTSVEDYITSLRTKFNLEAQEGAIKGSLKQEATLKQSIIDIGNETDLWAKVGITSEAHARERANRINAIRQTLLQQQIETNKLIGNSVQSGSKEQIKAAESDLAIIESQKKNYNKGSVELQTLEKQFIEKQQEINDLRNVKKPEVVVEELKVPKNKAFYDKVIEDNKKLLEGLNKAEATFEKDAAPLKKKIADAQRELLSFNVTNPGKADKEETALKRKADMLNKIYDINDKYNNKSLTDDEQKLAEIRSQYKSLQHDIDVYNKDPKNKKVNPDLKPAMEKAIENQQYEIDTKNLKVYLDEQKQIYVDYEEYKTTLGKDAADKRFKNEIDLSLSYLDDLKIREAELLSKGNLSGREADRLKDIQDRVKVETDAEKKKYDDLIKSLISYQEERKVKIEKYNADFARLQKNPEAQAELTRSHNEELKQLDESQIKKWDSYKDLFDNLEFLNKKELDSRIQLLKDKIKAELAAGNITVAQAEKINREISGIGRSKNGAGLELVIQRLQSVASEISGINNDIGSIVGSLTSAAANYISISKDMKTMNDSTASAEDQNAAKVGLYAQAANGLLSMITGITNAAAERKRVTEEFYKSAIDFQNQYNLTLIEQARLESVNKRGIFSKDSLAEIKDGLKASGMAMVEYQKKIDDLHKGQAKVGLRNAVDWKSTGSMIAGGIGVGAAVGSIVPVIGTAIGAVVGGIVGFIGGLFGTKKKKDTYAGLLTEFPELILKSADGTRLLNTGLAQQLIAQNQVNDATKQYLQAAIDAEKELSSAREQVNEGIQTLVGSIDDDLRNALVDAFKAGEDGMKAFEGTVARSMENIISNLAFQAIFNDAFKELESNMKDSFSIAGDGNIVDDLEAFYKLYGSLTKEFDAALDAASTSAKEAGIDLFSKNAVDVKALTPNTLTASLNQETGERLEGLWRGQFDITKQTNLTAQQILNIAKSNLDTALKIEANTLKTANNTDRLANIETTLASIDKKTGAKTTRD